MFLLGRRRYAGWRQIAGCQVAQGHVVDGGLPSYADVNLAVGAAGRATVRVDAGELCEGDAGDGSTGDLGSTVAREREDFDVRASGRHAAASCSSCVVVA